MAQDGNIGAARISLVVDADDYLNTLKRGKSAAAEFGEAAERAFEQSTGKSRTAQQRLLDYVATLGAASTEQQRFLSLLSKASGSGAQDAVLKAATKGYNDYTTSVELARIKTEAWEQGQKRAMGAARELAVEVAKGADAETKAANARARAYVEGRAQQQAVNSQAGFNARLGVQDQPRSAAYLDEQRRILEVFQQQDKELERQLQLTAQIDAMRSSLQERIGAEHGGMGQFDQLEREASRLGADNTLGPYIQQLRQMDAEQKQAAESARQLATAWDQAARENAEFDRQLAKTRQEADSARSRIEALRAQLTEKIAVAQGGGDQYSPIEREAQRLGAGNALAPQIAQLRQIEQQQRAIVEATQAQAAAENAVEAEAREIHRQWVAVNKEVQAATSTMNHYDRARANAVQQFGPVNAKPILDQITALEKANTTIRGTTVNAKQLQQAIRFLPAQFTDIGVSLAGGMNPLLVAFQQGGQILDQFRLSGMDAVGTFKAIGTYAAGLVNPVTIAGVAIAGLAYSAYDAAKAMEDLAIASTKGFGQSGSAEELNYLVESINKLENIRLSSAEAAVAKLAAGGSLAGENLRDAAEAAARWASVSGEAVDQVVSQFDAIARDPLQAIESGVVRVTQAQYDQIRVLVAQGNQQEAVNRLTQIWVDTINGNSARVEGHLSAVSEIWRAIADGASTATREAAKYADVAIRGLMDIGAASDQLRELMNGGKDPAGQQSWAPQLLDVQGDQRARRAATELAEFLATADETQQRAITLNRIRENGIRLGVDEATTFQIIARQEKLWAAADAKKNKSGSRGGTGARTAARDVRYDYQLESALLQTQTREVQAAYAVKQITAESYYASLIKFAQQEFDIQKRSNAEQLAAIGGKKGQEHEVARLRVADAIAEQQLAQRTIDINSQKAQYTEQLTREREAYSKALRDGVQAQQEEFQVALNRLTMGDKEFERWNAENELRREGIRLWEEATRWAKENPNQVEEGQRRVQAAIQATNDKLNQTAAAYANIDAAQADWANGASKAWKNWRDDVSDVSAHAEKVTTESLDAISDLTTDALTGNLKSWGDYFDGIAYMITQFIVKQQLTKWMQSLSAGGGAGGAGFWDKAAGFFAGILGGYAGGGATGAGAASGSMPTTGPTFSAGGFTGHGSDNEIAGLVHKNEYVVPAPVVRAIRSGRTGGTAPAAPARGPVTIIQNNRFEMASDRTTRGQYLREQAKQTNKALAKV